MCPLSYDFYHCIRLLPIHSSIQCDVSATILMLPSTFTNSAGSTLMLLCPIKHTQYFSSQIISHFPLALSGASIQHLLIWICVFSHLFFTKPTISAQNNVQLPHRTKSMELCLKNPVAPENCDV